jgi:GH43 family beta-xylosidase
MKHYLSFLLLLVACTAISCGDKKKEDPKTALPPGDTYVNPLLPTGAEPWAIYHNGKYYYTHGCEDRIIIWETDDMTDLRNARQKEVWQSTGTNYAFHLWGPEIHYLNNKWYIYFTADNGNMDNHQIYVVENSSEDPLEGAFEMKGRISTDAQNNWAIHANVVEHNERLYMVWSGWQTRRIEAETSCIYIAEMENPWTLKSDRVLISKPEFEWERQWINPDGSRTAYPIYVNESPQFFHTKNKDKVIVYYSASGNWTPYAAVGMLYADADSDLLDAASWTKSEQPVFKQSVENGVFSTGNLAFIPSPNGEEIYFIYHARSIEYESSGNLDARSPRMQKLEWDEAGFPVLGIPLPVTELLKKPA